MRRIAFALCCSVVLLFQLFPGAPTLAQAKTERLFREFGYGDLTARTMFGSLSYFFSIPAGRSPQAGSQLILIFSHSPLLHPDRSTMTVLVNGQSRASVFLTAQNRERGRLSVALPAADGEHAFSANGYFIQVNFYMRLTDAVCEEMNNPGLWTTIHEESSITLSIAPSTDSPGLQALPSLFVPQAAQQPLVLVARKEMSPEELEAVGLIAFQAGRWSTNMQADPQIVFEMGRLAQQPSILVQQGDALSGMGQWGSLRWNGQSFLGRGGTIPADHGVIALDHRSLRLLVSGATAPAVLEAAKAIVDPQRRHLLAGDAVAVTGKQAADLPLAPAWHNGAASFAQLGIGERRISGPGEHVIDLSFDRPPGWLLMEGGVLELALASSTAVRTETSWVAATINGYELGTQQLRAGITPSEQRYQFELPVGLLNADIQGRPIRHLVLRLRVFLHTPLHECQPIPAEGIWATLLPTSAWLLPHDRFSGMDLGRFPAPLLDDASSQVVVVAPAQPSHDELTAALQVLGALGRWGVIEPQRPPRLLTADRVDAETLGQSSLILIGGSERNTLTAEALRLDPALAVPNTPLIYRPDRAPDYGLLRLAHSPWSAHYVLLLDGKGANGLALAAHALLARTFLAELRGQLIAVAEDLPAQSLITSQLRETIPSELVPQVIIPLERRFPVWQIVGAVLLGAFIATTTLVIIIRYRQRGKLS